MRRISWQNFLAVPALVCIASPAGYAASYLNEKQAQRVIFPGAQFEKINIVLTDAQRAAIKKKSGVPVRVKELRVWKVGARDFFIIDEVVGKHEFITYAIGILSDGSVKQIEIMEYRETYGYEIRNESWRNQFIGKKSTSDFKLDSGVKNISGATLSSRHIADGVKRVLITYENVLR